MAHHGGGADGQLGASRDDVLARCISRPGVRAQVHAAPDLYEVAGVKTGPEHPGRHAGREQIGAGDGLAGQNPGRGGTHVSSVDDRRAPPQRTLCITRRTQSSGWESQPTVFRYRPKCGTVKATRPRSPE